MAVMLTIGTAVYNVGEDFLRAHIEGIKKQLTDETELLLIDDCSTDNSGDICKEYADSDDRIRYIKLDKNGGLSCVRNRTINEAAGKWIFFADGDDLFSDYFIETALSFSDADYDIIIHDREVFYENKNTEKNCDIKQLINVPKEAGREISLSCLCLKPFDCSKYNLGQNTFYHAAWGAIYRKDFLLKKELEFPVGQKKAQDSVFNTYAYFYAENIAYLPYPMYYYRKNLQGITQRYSKDFAEMIRSLIKHHYTCIEKLYGNDEEIKKLYRQNRVMTFVLDGIRLNFFHKDNPNGKKTRKEEFLSFIESEPFKSSIAEFDLKSCDWWGWRVPIKLSRKKNFEMLDFLLKHRRILRLYGGLECRFNRLVSKLN